MKRGFYKRLLPILVFPLMMGVHHTTAQNPNGNRYNLAVYATGLQDGSPISASIKTVAQNTASTNLTGRGNYQLIERSDEFLKQIEEEKHFQQSGDVADNQIAEVGASYGAQKICVISITIEKDYLYVAARIVDVSTKTSYESGEADLSGYKGLAQIRPTVAEAIKRILDISRKSTTAIISPTVNQPPTNNIPPANNTHTSFSNAKSYLEFTINDVNFKMVFIQGGKMLLGCTSGNCEKDEQLHYVTLSDYYLGETEVTQALWKAVMGNNSSGWKGDLLPVEMVSWTDCQNFIALLNNLLSEQLQGYRFALPSEAQWEYAARGGQKSADNMNIYAGSNVLNSVAWYGSNRTQDVKQKRPNELGLYDMCGNVSEWCEDKYSKSYYVDNHNWTDPINNYEGSNYVHRGGSWRSIESDCRVSNREYKSGGYYSNFCGFRLALVRR